MGLISDAIHCAEAAKVQSDRPTPLALRAGDAGHEGPAGPCSALAVAPATPLALPNSDVDSSNPGAEAEAAVAQPLQFDAADLSRIDDRLVVLRDAAGYKAEEYRGIRTGLLAKWKNKRHLVHMVTSALAQEGKTITSLNLALGFAELVTRRTVVVEADLRRPQFARLLGLRHEPGLAEVLLDGAAASDVAQPLGRTRLDVIVAGRPTADRAFQLLSAPAVADLIKNLRRRYDHVIIDTPPVLLTADAGIVGALSDEVLLVARLNATPASLIRQAAVMLASYSAPVAGVIATNQEHGAPSRGGWARYQPQTQREVCTDAA
jgi:capsular exopolysaccharide synthesis family protein